MASKREVVLAEAQGLSEAVHIIKLYSEQGEPLDEIIKAIEAKANAIELAA